MAKRTHTPGPYFVAMKEDGDELDGPNGETIYDREGGVFAIVDDEPETLAQPWKLEDALLFSAAPDMLQLCRDVLDDAEGCFVDPDDLSDEWKALNQRLRDAIEKATGERPCDASHTR